MVLLVAPSGSGKDRILTELLKRGFTKCVTYTTRQIRQNEVDGVDYHFVSEDEFRRLIAKDFFVEHTKYAGNHYGTPKDALQEKCINIVEPNGMKSLLNNDKRLATIYVQLEEDVRASRMKQRGDSFESIAKRIFEDRKVFSSVNMNAVDIVYDNSAPMTDEKIDKLVDAIESIEILKKQHHPLFSLYI